MIYLIFKILIYLILAAGIGFGLGWGLRNLQARKSQDNDLRKVNDAKAKIPQLESQLRGRNEQIEKLKATISDHKKAASELKLEMEGVREELRGAHIESRKLKAQKDAITGSHDVLADSVIEFGDTEPHAAIAEEQTQNTKWLLRIAELEAELQVWREKQGADNFSELKGRLLNQDEDAQLLKKLLTQREAKIVALERERELQQRTLRMLHKQLEAERQQKSA